MNQHQITSQVRHLRYVCFVSEEYPYEALTALMQSLQQYWGGRYTPIVPVPAAGISASYVALLGHYDPDCVLYSTGVDVEAIKRLRSFNPLGYFELDEQGYSRELEGVYAMHLLTELTPGSPVLVASGLDRVTSSLLPFYKLNFGLEATAAFDEEVIRPYHQVALTAENFASINQLLHEHKPILRSQLARRNLNTVVLTANIYQPYNVVELVVAKDQNATADLFYYWNRQLYECRNVLYCTAEELTELGRDHYFGGLLHDLSEHGIPIEVISLSLDETEINTLIMNVLRPIIFTRTFRCRIVAEFPFAIVGVNGYLPYKSSEPTTTQTLISDSGLVQLPLPSFSKNLRFYPQKWAVDLAISRRSADYRNWFMFPLTTGSNVIVQPFSGRVRQGRELSIFVPSQSSAPTEASVELPAFTNLLRQLVSMPVRDGKLNESKFVDQGPHDSSNRLSAFLEIFRQDFLLLEDFFDDKFWVDTFKKLCNSEALAGDAITFNDLVADCVNVFRAVGAELQPRDISHRNEENLRLGLRRTVQELTDYQVLLPGFKLKCPRCSSIFWYPLQGAADLVQCNGCLRNFAFPVEQPFAYKLNTVVKNNILQARNKPDGNLTVIRTLACLHSRARHSFSYSPQVNLYENYTAGKPSAELDIAALVDGQLVIGEAKHSSAAFFAENNKSLISLVEVAREIYPDQVILACYDDQNGKLSKAEKALIHLFNRWEYQPTISTLLLDESNYNLDSHRYFLH